MAQGTPSLSLRPALQQRAHALLSRTDSLLSHLCRVLSTPYGTDKALLTLTYTVKLLYTQLARIRTLQQQQLLQSIARKAPSVLLPGETVLATISFPDTALTTLEASSRALNALISDFRVFVRLWGLLGIYAWGKGTWQSPPTDRVLAATVWAQVAVNIGYQWYENIAYLAQKGVLRGDRFGAKQQSKWYAWSSRFWAAHVGLEALRLLRVWQVERTTLAQGRAQRSTEKGAAEADEVGNGDGDGVSNGGQVEADRVEAAQAWRRAWYVNAAYAPMTVHYSLEEGCLSDEWLGVLGVIAGTIGFKHIWKQTA